MPPPHPIDDWTADAVTVRDIIAYREASVLVRCDGCPTCIQLNVFKIGARLADAPISRLRLKCERCGLYASTIEVHRARHGMVDTMLVIQLKPVWDEGHTEAQERSWRRVEAHRKREDGGKRQSPPGGS